MIDHCLFTLHVGSYTTMKLSAIFWYKKCVALIMTYNPNYIVNDNRNHSITVIIVYTCIACMFTLWYFEKQTELYIHWECENRNTACVKSYITKVVLQQ